MSDLRVTREVLAPAQSPLTVSSYFDPAVYERERERLFARSPRYIGHELSVPELGDYHALHHEGEGRALVRTPQGLKLVSNVCRHRQAVMLRGRGNTGSNI
ncbi:MAG: aromatic ring-hydroxylating dioxygenase subunit alpha, partial [Rhizobacter sp.]|nr:aromatic ring-hydroxylating dioxygenase subunit alpha [Rhizobacter sp.]